MVNSVGGGISPKDEGDIRALNKNEFSKILENINPDEYFKALPSGNEVKKKLNSGFKDSFKGTLEKLQSTIRQLGVSSGIGNGIAAISSGGRNLLSRDERVTSENIAEKFDRARRSLVQNLGRSLEKMGKAKDLK